MLPEITRSVSVQKKKPRSFKINMQINKHDAHFVPRHVFWLFVFALASGYFVTADQVLIWSAVDRNKRWMFRRSIVGLWKQAILADEVWEVALKFLNTICRCQAVTKITSVSSSVREPCLQAGYGTLTPGPSLCLLLAAEPANMVSCSSHAFVPPSSRPCWL